MKRILAAAVMIFIIFGLSSGVAKAETANFKKAALESYEKEKVKLDKSAKDFEDYLQKIPEDGIVSGKEILALTRKMYSLEEEKEAAEKYLGIYGIKTIDTYVINPDLKEALDRYLSSNNFFLYQDTKDQKVKKFFVNLTGQDIAVKSIINGNVAIFLLLVAGGLVIIGITWKFWVWGILGVGIVGWLWFLA